MNKSEIINDCDCKGNSRCVWLAIGVFLICSVFSGCKNDPPSEEIIHRVKVFAVGKKATGQSRRISGKVQAANQSMLSFGVGGKVVEIIVTEGDDVTEGQLLARLDSEPLRIKLEDARAKLNNARAKLVESQRAYERTDKLYKVRAVSGKDLDAATADLATANGNLKTAQGVLSQTELDFVHTKLVAPFAGKVKEISVDPFQEVNASEAIFTLQSSDTLEIEVRVPETLILHVDHGQVVQAAFPSIPDVTVSGTVTTIAAEAEEGNAFPVTIRLSDTDADLRPGMTASVTFNFDAYLEGRIAYLIPLSAIAVEAGSLSAGEYQRNETTGQNEAPVFVLDSKTGRIQQRKILVGDLRGNELEVYQGLEPGELVVTAGVAFLRDGMKAEVWTPNSTTAKQRGSK